MTNVSTENDGIIQLGRAAAAAGRRTPTGGYRYTELEQHLRWDKGIAETQHFESWADSNWNSHFIRSGAATAGAAVSTYGSSDPDPDIADLPTEPAAFCEALKRAYRRAEGPDGDYALVYGVLVALSTANASPDQRAGLWSVLALMPGVASAQDADDETGARVSIHAFRAEVLRTFTVTFDEETGELLSWTVTAGRDDSPAERHCIIRRGQVDRLGQRPTRHSSGVHR